MSGMLPFELTPVSAGYAALDHRARALGAQAAAEAARALSEVLGVEVAITARAVPVQPSPRAPAARVAIELGEVPATAVLEVEPGLVVALVDRLAGGRGEGAAAAALTPVEATALELLALAAADAACRIDDIETRLCPRVIRGPVAPAGALAVDLSVTAGAASGRARLLVPAAAVRALRAAAPERVDPGLTVPLSLRGPLAALDLAELDALAPGDVVVCDPPPGGHHALVLPGGARLRGPLEGASFHVEEVTMPKSVAELPVTVEVELARLDLSLGALAGVEPGAVLTLPVDRRGEVALRIGERLFARGELVDVDGAIGVRITAREVAP